MEQAQGQRAPIVVQKYGGSSVADAERIKAVAQRIVATREAGKQVCVVVSAMGKSTDQLLRQASEISAAPSRRELDMLLTCGERASMALLSMAVTELGYEAISFTGSQCGIMTNDRHSGARIVEVRPFRVEDELERGRVVIVAGFQGVSYKREITTLGRGGSDTTAVALAAALRAEYCEICSDVDGVYSADPRLVSAAELLEAISHDAMLELAGHGARVLHAQAVEFARRTGIALYARATGARATAQEGGGTRIDRPGFATDCGIAVTGQKGLVRLAAPGDGAAASLVAAAEKTALPLAQLYAGREGAELWVPLEDVPDWRAVRAGLPADVEVAEGMGAASAVGELLGKEPQMLARVCGVAAAAGVRVEGISTSPLRITVYCAEDAVDSLVQALHHALRES